MGAFSPHGHASRSHGSVGAMRGSFVDCPMTREEFLRERCEDSWLISSSPFAVIAGLMSFMEGLKLGLMPFGYLALVVPASLLILLKRR